MAPFDRRWAGRSREHLFCRQLPWLGGGRARKDNVYEFRGKELDRATFRNDCIVEFDTVRQRQGWLDSWRQRHHSAFGERRNYLGVNFESGEGEPLRRLLCFNDERLDRRCSWCGLAHRGRRNILDFSTNEYSQLAGRCGI